MVFDWAELVWAAVSVGKAEATHMVRFGFYSLFELLYRASIIFANLKEDSLGYLTKSDAFRALDPSEKGAMSYFFGLTTAKLIAEKQLGVSWLMHLDVYRDRLQPVVTYRGKVKPDLIGRNSQNEWIVIEGKGRSGTMPSKVITAAKRQTKNLTSVSGDPVSMRIAHGAFFDSNRLAVTWVDPPRARNAARLGLDREIFDSAYYAPIREALSDPTRRRELIVVGEHLCEMVAAPELDLRIGLASAENVVANAEAPRLNRQGPFTSEFVGGDGIAIQLGPSWSQDRMRHQPGDRAAVPYHDRVT